ncbi:MAG: glycosyltransferase [Micrococcales bacterium]|nr:glycosyltransferase [Micrococcales bacterium]
MGSPNDVVGESAGRARCATAVFQWAQEHGEVGGVRTSHDQLTRSLRDAGHQVRYVDTGSMTRAARALPSAAFTRPALHLLHLTRLWRAVILAPLSAALRGRTVLVLHSGSTRRQVDGTWPMLRRVLWRALRAYDEIWTVNDEILALLPPALRARATVVTPFDASMASCGADTGRDPHSMAMATNAGLAHYNADVGIEVGRLVRTAWPDLTLTILAYGNDGPDLARLRERVATERWITMPFDLPRGEVSAVLRQAGTFLRPTSWDGDSVIVREALASGARVVASDVAPRPRGVELAPLEPVALAEAVLHGGTPSEGLGVTETTLAQAATAALARLGS